MWKRHTWKLVEGVGGGGGATGREEKIGFGDKLPVHSPTRENSWTALHAYERGIVLALPCFAEPCSQNPGVHTTKLHCANHVIVGKYNQLRRGTVLLRDKFQSVVECEYL